MVNLLPFTNSGKLLYIILITLAITGLILPQAVFAQEVKQPLKAPETFDEARSFIQRIVEPLPRALKDVWQGAVAIWQRMYGLFKNFWDSTIWPKIEGIWQSILAFFGKEIEKRKETIQKELEKGKQEAKEEIKEEVEEAGQSLWQRLKDIIKSKL